MGWRAREEVQPKISTRSSRRRTWKGTGLGLTVAYAIVQEHGGRITITSEAERGASAPVESRPSAPVRRRHRSRRPVDPAPESVEGAAVLVVEDEAALGAAVAESLQDAGFVVERANDGFEALERVRQQHFDLIICDLKVAEGGGMEFYRELRRQSPR